MDSLSMMIVFAFIGGILLWALPDIIERWRKVWD